MRVADIANGVFTIILGTLLGLAGAVLFLIASAALIMSMFMFLSL